MYRPFSHTEARNEILGVVLIILRGQQNPIQNERSDLVPHLGGASSSDESPRRTRVMHPLRL